MKKITIILIFSFLLNTLSMVQANSIRSRLLLEYEQKFLDKPIIIDTRFFQRYSHCTYCVNYIKQSANKYIYSDKLIMIQYIYENGVFNPIIYEIHDYRTGTYSMFDKTKKVHFSGKLDKEEFLFNKREKIERVKSKIFSSDFYIRPYLGVNFLKSVKCTSEHIYVLNNIKIAKGKAVFMALNEPFSAKFTIEPFRITESYYDQSNGRMIRIIEASPDNLDLNDLDTLTRIAQNKLKAYYPLSEEKIN